MNNLYVIGSLNMDLVGRSPRFVEPGETLMGGTFGQYPGGKGANQAVALARLGGKPLLIGALGDDTFGRAYREILGAEGIDDRNIVTKKGSATGVAMIEVAETGENRILVLPGANTQLTPEDVLPALAKLQPGDLVLMQLEIALATVIALIPAIHARGGRVILDPAPAAVLPKLVLQNVDIMTPNQTEAQLMAGITSAEALAVDLTPARVLCDLGIPVVVQKAGRHGAWWVQKGLEKQFPAFPVTVVDTTAAGDTFNAGLALALAQGKPLEEAMTWANAAAALSTTKHGAQAGMPTWNEVQNFLAQR